MTHGPMLIVANARGTGLFLDLLPWLVLLTVFVIVGGVIVLHLRRSIYSDHDDFAEGFTLQRLRELHAEGKLSAEEFEQAKAAMIGRLNPTKTNEKPDKQPKTPGNDSES